MLKLFVDVLKIVIVVTCRCMCEPIVSHNDAHGRTICCYLVPVQHSFFHFRVYHAQFSGNRREQILVSSVDHGSFAFTNIFCVSHCFAKWADLNSAFRRCYYGNCGMVLIKTRSLEFQCATITLYQ